MARPKKKVVTEEVTGAASFDHFKDQVEKDGIRVMTADQLGDPDPNKSGSYNLDYDLSTPFPAGRITEVYGPEGTCKTTTVLEALGQAIVAGKRCLYVNMEKNLNLSLVRTVRTLRPYIDQAVENSIAVAEGKKPPHDECPLWILNATTGEQALEAMRTFASMVPNGVAALDSIDAAQPEAVLSGEIGENKVGNLAKLMSDGMRKLVGISEQNNVALIFVNQIREKITMYGDPEDTPGGRAMKFYASQRIKLMKPRKADMIVDSDGDQIGVIIRYKVVKNKVAPDGNEGAFPILFRNGIFREQELVTQCCNFGVLRMGGKGGKQVYLPKLDRKTGEFEQKDGERVESCMTQFNAARRLLMDEELVAKLDEELNNVLDPTGFDPLDGLIDEVQES